MLKQLKIENFKVWENTGSIRMAPISLFFGVNSSGKSSIGQFLMMLKQTVELPDRKVVFYSGGQNSAVQLGSYQEMVFHRDPKNKIAFEYQWSLSDTLAFKDPTDDKKSFNGNMLVFQATVSLDDKDQHTLVLDHFKYELLENNESKLSMLSVEVERNPQNEKYTVEAEKYQLKRKSSRVQYLGMPVRFYGFSNEMVAYHQNADFVQILNLQHEKLFHSLSYLGPLRTKPQRLYSWTGIKPESVGYAGENTVAAILAAKNREINLGYKQKKKRFVEIIALKLKEMGLIEEFKVESIAEQRQEYEVKVRVKGSIDWVDLPDVGFGISQVLPVLVQCFYAPSGSIILMEQPEIHLHPSAQSALADVMIDVINSRENGRNRNIQLIIETHSEHFLRRLQRRIAEGKLLKEEVSAYFANVTTTPATLEPLQIDILGNIRNWPKNFFGDEMEDIIEQSKAAIKRRMTQNV